MENFWISMFHILFTSTLLSLSVFTTNAIHSTSSSSHATSFNAFLHERAIKQAFLKKLLEKLGMKNRPPPIPLNKRKQFLPRPLIDGGLSATEKEDSKKKVEIVVASEQGGGTHCQDASDCFIFKLNHIFLQNYNIEYAALHIHNEASIKNKGPERRTILVESVDVNSPSRTRRQTESVDKASRSSRSEEAFGSSNNGKEDHLNPTMHWLNDQTDINQPEEKESSSSINDAVISGRVVYFNSKTNQYMSYGTEFNDSNSGKKENLDSYAREKERVYRERRNVKDFVDDASSTTPFSLKEDVFVRGNDWFRIHISDIIDKWAATGTGASVMHGLHISCRELKINKRPRYRPFIVIKLHEKMTSKRRKKRSYATKCAAKYDKCCLRKLFVRFKDIKWHDWIIEPDGYEVNYCEGRCTGTGIMSAHTHAFIKQKLMSSSKLKNLQVCCIPLKFSTLTLLHYDEDGSIHQASLDNMSVLECGCV